ncbi:unnamed protein product [Nippostrongylus brasiliensis]|uniref:V-SNARE coiled-coil homology domain-containing protein n=1 Tax=Nippostrongylus brasiliensis TaxID=27835 RepID=A0A0N4YBI1_NIPBR|nr:unnamed protein product [Nippostrongylus brasiliensis]
MNASGASNSKNCCPPKTFAAVDLADLRLCAVDLLKSVRRSRFIREAMENFNYPVSKIGCDDKIMHTRRQLDEVMGMMRSNIEKLSERSEKLEDLACRAGLLNRCERNTPTPHGFLANVAAAEGFYEYKNLTIARKRPRNLVKDGKVSTAAGSIDIMKGRFRDDHFEMTSD